MNTMKVEYYCGHYIGQPKWKYGYDYYYEPDECSNSGIIEVDEEEWNDGCVSHICERCGAELCQGEDSFELLEEPT